MKLIVNGNDVEWDGASLKQFVESQCGDPSVVATLVNGDVVPRDKRDECVLNDGDSIEMIAFAAGG
jgi:thiamine biosynthesis protein ThiS